MPAKLVPTVQTKYSQFDLIKGFIQGWIKLFNVIPEKKQIAVIWAQNALETGLTAAMWNNNIGNVKYVPQAGDTEAIKYCMLKNVWEIINGKKVIFQPPHPATWFRSFETLEEGIAFFFALLRNKRYKIAWSAVESGDPALFAKLLRQQGYYTASEEAYRNAMLTYYNKFMASSDFEKALSFVSGPVIPEPKPEPPVVQPPPSQPEPVEPAPVTPPPSIEPPADNKSIFEMLFTVIKNILSVFKRN